MAHATIKPKRMSNEVRSLEPQSLWNHFADLNAVPRPSKKEERVIQFIVDFGKKLNLETIVDEVGNVIIKKPASPGMEDRQTVVLQSHLDMVHQKNNNTDFDFDTQGIEMYVDNDWVKAKGTTLGADNGLGVAAIMALLSSTDLQHPPLEALFTIDEETGMTGAMGLKGGLLEASIMLNLDTEDDNELTIGCAGGVDVTAMGKYSSEPTQDGHMGMKLTINGLSGGHSGMDIHKGLGNANKLLNRVLSRAQVQVKIRLAEIDGGGLRNAIPREATALLAVPADGMDAFVKEVAEVSKELREEYRITDPQLAITAQETDVPKEVCPADFQHNLVRAIYACPNGIYRMSPDVENLVQTSNNIARVILKDGQYSVMCLTRSAVDSEKWDLGTTIRSIFELIDGKVEFTGDYPGWAPKHDAAIIPVMADLYRELFPDEPFVNVCHAGLECGLLGTHYPEMEMISFGPNIRGAHSPDEKVQISSVQKFWKYLLETLKRVPKA